MTKKRIDHAQSAAMMMTISMPTKNPVVSAGATARTIKNERHRGGATETMTNKMRIGRDPSGASETTMKTMITKTSARQENWKKLNSRVQSKASVWSRSAFGARSEALGIFLLVSAFHAARIRFFHDIGVIAALPGLANWIVSLVGIGFLIAGPKKGNLFGLSIATSAVSGVQLLIILYVAYLSGDSFHSMGTRYGPVADWDAFPSLLFHFIAAVTIAIATSFEFFPIWLILGGLLEVARFVLIMLMVKEFGSALKSKSIVKNALHLLIALPSIVVITSVIVTILAAAKVNSGIGGGGGIVFYVAATALFAAFIATFCKAALVCNEVKNEIDYRKK